MNSQNKPLRKGVAIWILCCSHGPSSYYSERQYFESASGQSADNFRSWENVWLSNWRGEDEKAWALASARKKSLEAQGHEVWIDWYHA